MKQKLSIQHKDMTEEEILSNPDMMAAFEEFEEVKRKGVKSWKLELDKVFDDIQQGKPIHLSAKLAKGVDKRFLQSLSDIKAGRIRRVR